MAFLGGSTGFMIILLCFLSFFQTGTSLKCYQCLSLPSENCGLGFLEENAALITCKDEEDYCVTTTGVITFVKLTMRDCATRTSCNDKNLYTCDLCRDDKCNSQSQVNPSSMVICGSGLFVLGIIQVFNKMYTV